MSLGMFHLSDFSSNDEKVCTFVYGSAVYDGNKIISPTQCDKPIVYQIVGQFIKGNKYCCEHHKNELLTHWSYIDSETKFINI